MAKNFGKSPITKRFDEVAKSTMINTNVKNIKLIENSALMDYPNNGEDILYTADLEKSIKELGFTDPIEITSYKMPDGKYMILSGHRRRAAGTKCGMTLFPCVIKSFENDADVANYVLLANSQRDTEKDPLLYCRRYKLHEQYLKSINFKGSVHEEIAERLGVSLRQADRYNQMNKIISPVWELIRDDDIGMSSVLPMVVLSDEEQQDIFGILKNYIENGIELTREKIKIIIEDYKNRNSLVSSDDEDSCEQGESDEQNEHKKSDELEKKEKYDKTKEIAVNTGNIGRKLITSLKKLNETLETSFIIYDRKDAENVLREMVNTFDIILDKTYFIGRQYGLDSETKKILENLFDKIKAETGKK